MKTVTLKEHQVSTAAELHEFLACELAFPAYYGKNLSALNDCLTEISEPTRIMVWRDDSVAGDWFDKACAVMVRAALENEHLHVTFESE